MRRSLGLVVATSWLLALSACGDQPRPRAPSAQHARPAHRHGSSHRGSTAEGPDGVAEGPEIQEEKGAIASGPEPRTVVAVSSEKLAERFGRTRAISTQSGSASYYGDGFAGRPTASGAAYEPGGFTAAHRTLPFGTVLRVTRTDGEKTVYVTVTDRGPYGPRGRILDLSRAAAERLGMLRAGVVSIKLEVVELGPRKKRRRKR